MHRLFRTEKHPTPCGQRSLLPRVMARKSAQTVCGGVNQSTFRSTVFDAGCPASEAIT